MRACVYLLVLYMDIFNEQKIIMIDYTFYFTCLILPRSEKKNEFASNALKVGTHTQTQLLFCCGMLPSGE